MSSLAAIFARRAALRQSVFRQQLITNLLHAFKVNKASLAKGLRRDPELYILLGIMAGAFGIAGWYLGSSPTMVTSESNIHIGESVMLCEQKDQSKALYKYEYHSYDDTSKPVKRASSALDEVIMLNVTLLKDLHDKFNKYEKDDY
ncbi:hypothetical protein AJ79_06289 [Helicocarpus griseus UAMH5409]|uniref:Uncharacterized protein n=1 Tax=Helicocarpus griseus UAMH5409 TaxID=1447875 RepID=A0A2B7XFH2_9EURO|nr:hypothetical protein AJ79_06289 [Helicocarpus griseus UAMH5409]